ncbi:S-layer homology domain-containing protein [Cytobacillus sp. FJAT-53684]|uniref:S-layer homology domain-containing protein n=1 Tax=Cytobacillus mangrovibacter TaxID=3299024 RepID=A0ABW6JX60_9BACI
MIYRKHIIFVLVIALLLFNIPQAATLAATTEQYPISSGVNYKHNNEVINSNPQAVNILEINLLDSYTNLALSFPDPLHVLATTTKQAKANHYEGHQVIGAVNGSFFDTATKDPMYLIASNNQIVNIGLTTFEKEHYVNKPAAFGITSSGKGLIDDYQLSLTLSHNGQSNPITSMNKTRNANELILYTPENRYATTKTNQYGTEIIITNASKNRNLAFGDTITGTVSAIRSSSDPTASTIPEDGFILSAHGDKQAILSSMNIGDQVQVDLTIDEKWKNAQFMLASGPMLVNNGAVSLNMDPNNIRAKERAPRTAIALDKTQAKAFMVTVDGRQSGYSKGMTLMEFAQYLAKIGVDKAINLDGGGSTSMIVRKHGNELATLINRPSDGYERAVSTTLQVINSSPLGKPKYINATLSASGEVQKGTKINVNLKYVLDQFYTPIIMDLSKLKISSTIGEVQGQTVTASKAGKGTITVTYEGISSEFPIQVMEEKATFSDVPPSYKYYKEISTLTSNKIINGFPDGTFRPNNSLTRLDAALLLSRILKLDTTNVPDVEFNDVPKTHKYYKEVAAIAGKKVMNGKAEKVFDPTAPLTRAEMAVILHRAFKLSGNAQITFTDVPVGSFGYESISALLANQITEGFPDNTFRPKESVNRFQFVLFLYRIQY